ncbi:MAG: flagellar basal body rod protein FlgC [Catonella sp.]|jgi:flagellar basal-body rod protein FlgC|nr:flagellar basal body rod protein FlgC [Catonella sp.]MDY6356187.1 flagellar basal body rod protein FlgC [Catonella sp.]
MSIFGAMDISATGMTAEQLRNDIITQNIANVNTTRDENGHVYRRKNVIFNEKDVTGFSQILLHSWGTVGNGVKVSRIYQDTVTPTKLVYDPSHPDANEEGYVEYPNVNIVQEMTDMIDASRAYEANVTAFNATKSMLLDALNMGSGS